MATVGISYSILLLLLGIVTFAHPSLRSKRHDHFERVHRYFGWTAIILVWAQVVILTNDYRGVQTLSYALVHSAPFWMLLVMTGLLYAQLDSAPLLNPVVKDPSFCLGCDSERSRLEARSYRNMPVRFHSPTSSPVSALTISSC